jgi:hypothetical protein
MTKAIYNQQGLPRLVLLTTYHQGQELTPETGFSEQTNVNNCFFILILQFYRMCTHIHMAEQSTRWWSLLGRRNCTLLKCILNIDYRGGGILNRTIVMQTLVAGCVSKVHASLAQIKTVDGIQIFLHNSSLKTQSRFKPSLYVVYNLQ